jgi:galactokinase
MMLQQRVAESFVDRFGKAPAVVVRAPGRVNLIGEHTDYNDGFVLPMAIDRALWIALRPRADSLVRAYSIDFDQEVTFSLDALNRERAGWAEYVKGVAWALQEAGHSLGGWEGAIAGDVPLGAGLSSSAALEMATARAFAAVSGLDWDPAAMALLGQKAENKWVGMNCGIMDQMISAAGEAGHALLIDCRSLATEAVPLPPGTVVVVLDTATRRDLVDSAYNERRAQCEAAARYFGGPALRDVSLRQLEAGAGGLDELARRRARHVITENERTLQAAEAMRKGNAVALGRLMDASHVSMRDDFEISNEQLNEMVELAQAREGCFGARMTGGGFGGCAVALVAAGAAGAFAAKVGQQYESATGLEPSLYICEATAGAELLQGGG